MGLFESMASTPHKGQLMSTSYLKRGLLTVGVIALASSCVVVLEGEDQQCSTDADCKARGFDGAACIENVCRSPSTGQGGAGGQIGDGGSGGEVTDPKWGCVGNVQWDEPTEEVIPITAKLVDLIGEQAIPGASAKTCPPLDIDCQSPHDEGISDADGLLKVNAHYGFRGYTLIEPPAEFSDMAPAIIWNNPPLYEETDEIGEAVHLASEGDIAGAALLAGATLNPERGHVFGLTVDCMGITGGVSLATDTVSPDTVGYYIVGSLPSKTATETDFNGNAGFINLPEGLVTISGAATGIGKYGEVSVLVKAGHVTYVAVAPSPL